MQQNSQVGGGGGILWMDKLPTFSHNIFGARQSF